MKIRHLQTRFILAGALLVMTTIVSGIWSASTFIHLSTVVGKTLETSQQTTDLTAVISNALEREDDALLLAVSGDRAQAKERLQEERQRFETSFALLQKALNEPDEKTAAANLRKDVDEYRAAGDAFLATVGQTNWTPLYLERVNPALRKAIADCGKIRELNFRSMEFAGFLARDEAHGATILVTAISLVAFIISTLVAVLLARSVLVPIRDLSESVEALRLGDFDRRVKVIPADELGSLAVGFNRMAEALAEVRRSNLSEVIRAKETLEATLAALPDAVLVIDPAGRIVTMNPLAKAVLEASDAQNAAGIDDLHFLADSSSALHAALRGERSNQTRAEFSRAFAVALDGRRAKFMLTVVPIPEFSQGRFGAVALLYDVTDFARLDELRMELVAVASHELKTPLTTLRMNLMLLGEKAENLTPRQQEILATALLGCQELANTIDELLDLTRIEAGQLRLAHDMVDLYAVIDRSIDSIRQRFEDAAISVDVNAGCRPALVRGDPTRLGMVFTNLLSNSLKYTPGGGSVSINVTLGRNAHNGDSGILQIAVTDTGPGIPAAFRERVFEKFFRVEQQFDGGRNGTWGAGIGLYLCRQIVEAHGGTISCDVSSSAGGTRIAITLPPAGASAHLAQ
jgi:two-component system, NtrC family, sensor histidine kinase KinB